MKQLLLALLCLCLGTILNPASAQAQLEDALIETGVELSASEAATLSAQTEQSTPSGSIASASAEAEKKIQEKKDEDLTETTGLQKNKLVAFLDENPPESLNLFNPLQHAIRYAVAGGVPPTTIVLIILFPLVASMIAASRHVIGLRGFGIYIPAVLSVALISTGVLEGITIFLAIALTATLAKAGIRKLKLPYLPRTALLLWTVSLGILAILIAAPTLNLVSLMSAEIFPILILILLAENFLDAQARTKQSEALALTIETIVLAVVAGYILKWEPLQKLVLVEPEIILLGTAICNGLIGRFTGLRLSERMRFRALIEEE